MASTAISAQQTTISIDGTVIENVVSFSGMDGERAEIDSTNLSSTAKERLLGLQDYGSFSMEIHRDHTGTAAGQEALIAAQGTDAASVFVVTYSDNSTATFNGLVKNATSTSGGVDALLGGSVSIAIDGDVTYAPAP